MQDRFTDEESAHEHLADSLRDSTPTKSVEQLLAKASVSCQRGKVLRSQIRGRRSREVWRRDVVCPGF